MHICFIVKRKSLKLSYLSKALSCKHISNLIAKYCYICIRNLFHVGGQLNKKHSWND